ncbi:MAG: four helix bundle protein [Ignavibacterium sp.]|nr:four helix bundle protein [Ignavibacterium sp.]MDW8376398.1 four helix bundle protein [Ignavibacteriales bacterium]
MIINEQIIRYYNPIVEKSFHFAVRIVKFYRIKVKDNYDVNSLLKQLLRAGTSIGANVSEAQSAFTKKDFINKLGISLKESKETEYWLKLLKESEIISEKEFLSLFNNCEEIIKLLTSIIKSSKEI